MVPAGIMVWMGLGQMAHETEPHTPFAYMVSALQTTLFLETQCSAKCTKRLFLLPLHAGRRRS